MSGARNKVTHFVLWRATYTEIHQGERAACGAWIGAKAKRSSRIGDVDCSACLAKARRAVSA